MAKVLTIGDDELIGGRRRVSIARGLTVHVVHTGHEGLAQVMGAGGDVRADPARPLRIRWQ
jgi:hypothetical protein